MRPSLRATVLLALLVAPASHAGQRASASAGDLYSAAASREQALRAAVDRGAAPLKDYRAVVNAFENVVRKYPTSGYVDNALWRGAAVAREAFERFGDRSRSRDGPAHAGPARQRLPAEPVRPEGP